MPPPSRRETRSSRCFTGSGDDIVKNVADSTEGFSLMLAGMKAFLEHDLRLNLVGDRFPKGV